MREFLTVMGHTYMTKLKSKAFITTTLITLAFILVFMNMDRIISLFDGGDTAPETTEVLVLGDEEAAQIFEDRAGENALFAVTRAESEADEEALEAEVQAGEADGLLHLEVHEETSLQAEWRGEGSLSLPQQEQLQQILSDVQLRFGAESAGLDVSEVEALTAPVALETVELGDSGSDEGVSEVEQGQAMFLVYILLFVIYFSVIFLGNMVSMEVATEKSSRVMEILISSVSPEKQMFGKIAGVALLGLTKFALIFLLGGGSLLTSRSGEEEAVGVMDPAQLLNQDEGVSLLLIAYAFLFFMLGFLLYATLSAMLGSVISRIEDVGQANGPINMVIIMAFFIAMFGLNAPDSTIVTITSFIPFFTPMIMFLRVGMTDVPWWEVSLSIALMALTIMFFAWLGARVYRGGVLMYGKSSALKDIKRAIRLR
ncbi:ABC-2 type transport system permease protein [Salsuginibacillus halophilus]|uniref:ABC-2 type transport system permease protein n=1 Tax=Salsuginibacillus halophilus TaxID=517424 RepID=A0A2P8HG25_9BACI|nr:ABC transporter permease [Salsuginibacillus halophilus]PSL45169.1 ABC-2 type transport system permease protein [Salsuginibacillus halophilus]